MIMAYLQMKLQMPEKLIPKKKREDMVANMNEGSIRIVLGSTKKLGTGINAQHRCVGIHHIDIPWTPASVEQRNGRG